MIMKVLLINGSPHAKGSTFTALNEVVKSLEKEGIETEMIQIGNQVVSGTTSTSQMNFKVNIFSIGLGASFYL